MPVTALRQSVQADISADRDKVDMAIQWRQPARSIVRSLRECGVTRMQGYLIARPAFEALPVFSLPERRVAL